MFFKRKSIPSLTKKTEKIHSVFTQIETGCKNLNADISAQVAAKEEQIKNLQSEAETLNVLINRNEKLANKITGFINS